MFNSQYYTCEQVDERLLQGYVDDFNEVNSTNYSKDELLLKLFQAINWDQVFGKYEENQEFVRVYTDINNKLLWGIKINGDIYYGAGVPSQIKNYIDSKISESPLNKVEDILIFLDDLIDSDKTLKELLLELYEDLDIKKVDKVVGKSLIDEEYASTKSSIENPEFLEVTTDSEDKILEAFKYNGTKVIGGDLQVNGDILFNGSSLLSYLEYIQQIINNNFQNIDNIINNPSNQTPHGYLLEQTSDGWLNVILDSDGKLLGGRKVDGTVVENMPQEDPIAIKDFIESSEWLSVKLDNQGRIYSYRDKQGVLHEMAGVEAPNILSVSDIQNIFKENIGLSLNYDQECSIYSAARYYQYSNSGDFQAMLIADTHANNTCIERAINVTNKIKSINCFIHLGDIIGWTPFDKNVNRYDYEGGGFDILLKNILPETCDKPWFITPGNHDVGVTPFVGFTRTDEEVYNDLIKPMIDQGMLREGEYNTTGDYSDRCYYFHDFHNKKVRIISLYEYGWEQQLDENQYWEPVTYDANAPQMKQNTQYVYDENNPIILNCHGYKKNSFRLKKTVTTIGATTSVFSDTVPRFKCVKGYQIFTKNQLEWLANTLNSTPDGYGIVILSHQALMDNVNVPNYKFSCNSNPAFGGYNPRGSGKSYDQLTDNLVISKIVDAWKNKASLVERVAAIPGYSIGEVGDPTYLNILEDNGYHYMYELSLDFSLRTNDNAYFSCFLNGHEHLDSIEQSKAFPYQLSIIDTCGNPPFRNGDDIASVSDANSRSYDCLTIFTERNKNGIVLCKYGNTRTTGGIERDFEIISYNNLI